MVGTLKNGLAIDRTFSGDRCDDENFEFGGWRMRFKDRSLFEMATILVVSKKTPEELFSGSMR
jgi:hypothetical protein